MMLSSRQLSERAVDSSAIGASRSVRKRGIPLPSDASRGSGERRRPLVDVTGPRRALAFGVLGGITAPPFYLGLALQPIVPQGREAHRRLSVRRRANRTARRAGVSSRARHWRVAKR